VNKKVDYEAINPIHGNVNYLEELRYLSRKNRKNPTMAEERIWQELLSKRKTGYKFLRQKPIHRFILDFYCSELNLAIEIDGGSHNRKKGFDLSRDQFLKQIGIKTVRFTNEDIINNIEKIKSILTSIIPPPCQGRGLGGWVKNTRIPKTHQEITKKV
jgi:very-short-patch-repair endonuclease